MIENEIACLLYTCDTTTIERNYDNFTYYSNKCPIKIPKKRTIMQNLLRMSSKKLPKVFDVERILNRNRTQLFEKVGYKQILEQCADDTDGLMLQTIETVYQWRKIWWKKIIDTMGRRKWG